MSLTAVYQRLVSADRREQSGADQRSTAYNGTRQLMANALQSTGDQVVNAKTVLPWLFSALGVPAAFTAMLVPVRESGSMLPQAALMPWVGRTHRRRYLWVLGAAGQAFGAGVMAFAAAALSGAAAGLVVLLALLLFSLSRALCSLAGKDVLGRTVPKGERGQINGLATVLSGAVAVTLGVGIRLLGGESSNPVVIAILLGVAALLWVVALTVFAGIREPDAEPVPTRGESWVGQSLRLFREDATFGRFVLARALLLVSALSPPFVVAIAAQAGGGGLEGLGPFVIAQGVASLIGGRIFGRLADRSSRGVMTWGAAAASILLAAFLLLLLVPGVRESWPLYPVTYLLLALIHTGVRVARKTYVVDMAEGDQRTEYVAVSNTAMGVILLAAGALSGGLALLGEEIALVFLALLGVAGVVVSRSLPQVSKG